MKPALESFDEIHRRIGARLPAMFIDYDGTLAPIVDDPERAILPERTRTALQRLSEETFVAVVSGRDREMVRRMAGLNYIVVAGSHGFDIDGPKGLRMEHSAGVATLPALDLAEEAARARVESIPGCLVERKRFGIAVHFRNVDPTRVGDIEKAVDSIVKGDAALKRTGGKMIFEIRPNIDWHKGHAVRWLIETLDLSEARYCPIYIGDDLTDEDAFRTLKDTGRGFGIRVVDEPLDSEADYSLANVDETRLLIERLVKLLEPVGDKPAAI